MSSNVSLSFRDLTEEFLKNPTNKTLLADVSKSLSKLTHCDESEKLDVGAIFTSLSKLYPNNDLQPLIVKTLNSETFAPYLKFYASLFPKHPYVRSLLFPHFPKANDGEKEEVIDPEMILTLGHSVTRQQATVAIKRCKNYALLKAYFSSQLRRVTRNDLFTTDPNKEKPSDNIVVRKGETEVLQVAPTKRAKADNSYHLPETRMPLDSKSQGSIPEIKIQSTLQDADEDLINSIIFEK